MTIYRSIHKLYWVFKKAQLNKSVWIGMEGDQFIDPISPHTTAAFEQDSIGSLSLKLNFARIFLWNLAIENFFLNKGVKIRIKSSFNISSVLLNSENTQILMLKLLKLQLNLFSLNERFKQIIERYKYDVVEWWFVLTRAHLQGSAETVCIRAFGTCSQSNCALFSVTIQTNTFQVTQTTLLSRYVSI